MNTFLAILVVLLPLAASAYGMYRFMKALRAPANDYSFGRTDLVEISRAISKSDFDHADMRMNQLHADDLTQVVDHIVMACPGKSIQKYLDRTENGSMASLLQGSRYLYLAWKIRGHETASKLSGKKITQYTGHLESAMKMLAKACTDRKLAAEAHSRMIRACMSLGYADQARAHFKEVMQLNRQHFWAYLHYAELIQPKWYGSVEEVSEFLKGLPSDQEMIRSAVRLKLLYDGLMSRENYFDLNEENTVQHVQDELGRVDAWIEKDQPASIHRFIIFGYMYLLAAFAKDKALEKKYKKRLGGNYALYPFGIMS